MTAAASIPWDRWLKCRYPDGEMFLTAGRRYQRKDGQRSRWMCGCILYEEDFDGSSGPRQAASRSNRFGPIGMDNLWEVAKPSRRSRANALKEMCGYRALFS